MSWLDVSTYIFLQSGALLSLFIGSGFWFFAMAVIGSDLRGEDRYILKRTRKGSLFLAGFFAILIIMPTHGKMLELKIAKIKNEAFTADNLNKGIETIKRVSRKLECKYLGCRGGRDED